MSLESKPKWTTPPIVELMLKLQYRVALLQKQKLEKQLLTADRILQKCLQHAKKAYHGK